MLRICIIFFLLGSATLPARAQWIVKPYGLGGDIATALGPRHKTWYVGANYLWNLRKPGLRNVSSGGALYTARVQVQLGHNRDYANRAFHLRLGGGGGMYFSKAAMLGPRLQSGVVLRPRPGSLGIYVEPGVALCDYLHVYYGHVYHPSRTSDGRGRSGSYFGFSLTLSLAPWHMLLDRIQGCS